MDKIKLKQSFDKITLLLAILFILLSTTIIVCMFYFAIASGGKIVMELNNVNELYIETIFITALWIFFIYHFVKHFRAIIIRNGFASNRTYNKAILVLLTIIPFIFVMIVLININ